MSQTMIKTSLGSSPPTLERYVRQAKEWQNFVCTKLTSTIERVLRSLYDGAKFVAKQKGTRDVEGVFRLMMTKANNWSDDECAREFSDPAKEIDACIRMAVRAQAIVMALTISKQCKEIIRVPNSQVFFKKVLIDTAGEHRAEAFGSADFTERMRLREWISKNIEKHLLALVPISIFTEEDDDKEDVEVKPKESVLKTPVVCDDKACTSSITPTVEPDSPPSLVLPSSTPKDSVPQSPLTLVAPPTPDPETESESEEKPLEPEDIISQKQEEASLGSSPQVPENGDVNPDDIV